MKLACNILIISFCKLFFVFLYIYIYIYIKRNIEAYTRQKSGTVFVRTSRKRVPKKERKDE